LGRSATRKKNKNKRILYMFRAVRCTSSGSLIVSMQHLVSSLSVGDCHLQRVTIPDVCIDTIILPEDVQRTARKM